jgi:hypothetical protein
VSRYVIVYLSLGDTAVTVTPATGTVALAVCVVTVPEIVPVVDAAVAGATSVVRNASRMPSAERARAVRPPSRVPAKRWVTGCVPRLE